MARYRIILTGVTDSEKTQRIALTIAHIFKISPEKALERLNSPPIILMRKAGEAQADKLLQIFRSLGADVIIEEEPEELAKGSDIEHDKGFVPSTRVTTHKGKIPGQASADAKLSLSTVLLISLLTLCGLSVGAIYFFSNPYNSTIQAQAQNHIRRGEFKEAHKVLKSKVHRGTASAGEYIQNAISLIMLARLEQDSIGWRDFGIKGLDSVPGLGADMLKTPTANRALMNIKLGLEKFPKDPEMHRWAGFIYQTKGMYQHASDMYDKAIRIQPDNVMYRNLMGTLNREQGLHDKSDYQFRSALNIDSTDVTALQNLTVLNLSHRKDTALAMIYFRKSENHKDPARYTLRREIAMASFKKFNKNAYKKEPKTKISWHYYEARQSQYNRLKQQQPEVRVKLADLYAKRGMISEALKELNMARAAGVESKALYAQLAQLYIVQEKPESALHILKEAEKKDIVNPEILKNLSLLHRYYSEDKSKANKFLKAYMAAGGDSHGRDLYDAIVP